MPYQYPNNIPKVAKHWTASQQRKCTEAANAVLSSGGKEDEAIFACIHAAGMGQKQEDEYDQAVEDGLATFQDMITAYFAGVITASVLYQQFGDAIDLYFTRLMTLGLDGKEPTEHDLDFLNGKITEHKDLMDDFLKELAAGDISEQRALWRAGLYATDREAYIFYTVPYAVVSLMEGLPGEICKGNGLCGCSLEVTFDTEGNATVEWIINPEKESCGPCLDMASKSPFFFTRDQIEQYG